MPRINRSKNSCYFFGKEMNNGIKMLRTKSVTGWVGAQVNLGLMCFP